jgi:hypothetical protein
MLIALLLCALFSFGAKPAMAFQVSGELIVTWVDCDSVDIQPMITLLDTEGDPIRGPTAMTSIQDWRDWWKSWPNVAGACTMRISWDTSGYGWTDADDNPVSSPIEIQLTPGQDNHINLFLKAIPVR